MSASLIASIIITTINVGIVGWVIVSTLRARRKRQETQAAAVLADDLLSLLPPDRDLVDQLRYAAGITIIGQDPDQLGQTRTWHRMLDDDVCTASYGVALIRAGGRVLVEHGADDCGAGQ